MTRRDLNIPSLMRFVETNKNLSACWNWTGATSGNGYGAIVLLSGEQVSAHRAMFTLVYGKVPDGFSVCHRCDNPRCCNPTHLFSATQSENIIDAYSKGRIYQGFKAGTAHFSFKVTNRQASMIRKEYAKGQSTQKAIAIKYGIAQSLVSRIVNNKHWTAKMRKGSDGDLQYPQRPKNVDQ